MARLGTAARHHERMWSKLLRRAVPVLALALAGGLVLGLAGAGTLATAAGLFLLGAAGVLAISFVFLEIGLAEDRERASGAGRPPGQDAAAPHGPERPGGSHGPRRRFQRRRRPE